MIDVLHLLIICPKAEEVSGMLEIDEIIIPGCDADRLGEAMLEFWLSTTVDWAHVLGQRSLVSLVQTIEARA